MTNHKPTVTGPEGAWQGKCTCKIRSEVFAIRSDADWWIETHMNAVQRARAHLMSHHPSLKDQRDWYRKQAARKDISEEERGQWLHLAEGLDHRIGKPVDEAPLFTREAGEWVVD